MQINITCHVKNPYILHVMGIRTEYNSFFLLILNFRLINCCYRISKLVNKIPTIIAVRRTW